MKKLLLALVYVVAITLPAATVVAVTGFSPFTNDGAWSQIITKTNPVGAGATALQFTNTLSAMDGSDSFYGIHFTVDPSTAAHTGAPNYASLIYADGMTGDANVTLYGVFLGTLTPTAAQEIGFVVVSGWDYGLYSNSPVYVGDTINGITVSATGVLSYAGTAGNAIKISSDADGMDAATMTAAGMYGTLFIATGAGTWILPRAVAGMNVCLMDSGTAHDLILDVTAGSTIRLKGTEGSDGVGITNASGTSTGDFVCVVAVATDKWSTMSLQGTWASE